MLSNCFRIRTSLNSSSNFRTSLRILDKMLRVWLALKTNQTWCSNSSRCRTNSSFNRFSNSRNNSKTCRMEHHKVSSRVKPNFQMVIRTMVKSISKVNISSCSTLNCRVTKMAKTNNRSRQTSNLNRTNFNPQICSCRCNFSRCSRIKTLSKTTSMVKTWKLNSFSSYSRSNSNKTNPTLKLLSSWVKRTNKKMQEVKIRCLGLL